MVTSEYRDYVIEQLRRASPAAITHRAMFGGVGIYADGVFFALIADDVLYFKVGGGNRATFEAHGMGPFLPYGDPDRPMSYYQLPPDVLESTEELEQWMRSALTVAREAKRNK